MRYPYHVTDRDSGQLLIRDKIDGDNTIADPNQRAIRAADTVAAAARVRFPAAGDVRVILIMNERQHVDRTYKKPEPDEAPAETTEPQPDQPAAESAGG